MPGMNTFKIVEKAKTEGGNERPEKKGDDLDAVAGL
eukprot:SAG11_NODE_399_length_9764_cov_8.760993_7_plen_36_part_00